MSEKYCYIDDCGVMPLSNMYELKKSHLKIRSVDYLIKKIHETYVTEVTVQNIDLYNGCFCISTALILQNLNPSTFKIAAICGVETVTLTFDLTEFLFKIGQAKHIQIYALYRPLSSSIQHQLSNFDNLRW